MDQETDVHLRWSNYQTSLLSVFSSLLGNGKLADCTISAEGQYFKAHRVILSACSPYFESLFSQHYEKHPIVILPDVKFQILKALVEFMYSGDLKVPQNNLGTVLELAETLQIKGLSATDECEMNDNVGPKRRNQDAILCDQLVIKKHQHEHRYDSQVKQRDNISSLNTSEKEPSKDTCSHLLTTQEYANHSSKSVSPEKTVEEPAVSQDITDSESFSDFRCSSLTKTQNKSHTHVSGMLLNSLSNILDSSQLPGSSKETIGEQRMLNENVVLTHSSSEEMRTSEPLGICEEKPAVDLVSEVKQENPDDFKGDSIDEIILDDDTDESDYYDHGSGGDNSCTVGGMVIPEESISARGFCSLEQHRDTYFVEPVPVLRKLYKCDACGKSYRSSCSLSRHLKYVCGKEPQFKCPQCPARYTSKHNLEFHVGKTHLLYKTQSVINRKIE